MENELKRDIRNMGYGFSQFKSKWVEDVIDKETGERTREVSNEESCFILNITKEEAIKLGNKYDQYSIICKHDDVCEEIFTKQIDVDGHTVGDVIRVFNVDGDKIFNVEDAKAIFANRSVGPVSVLKRGGKHTSTPFHFAEKE